MRVDLKEKKVYGLLILYTNISREIHLINVTRASNSFSPKLMQNECDTFQEASRGISQNTPITRKSLYPLMNDPTSNMVLRQKKYDQNFRENCVLITRD